MILTKTAVAKDVAVVKVASLKRVDEQDQEEGMLAKLELLGKANGLFPHVA